MSIVAADEVTTSAQPQVTVLIDRCAGCQECIIRCPTGALTMDAERWVAVADDARCVGCRQCERTCPFSAITVTGALLVSSRLEPVGRHPEALVGNQDEIRPGFADWDAALTEANRCLECPDPTCVRGCPAHNDIPAMIDAIRRRDLDAAHDVLRATSVLPDVCSRVCNQAAQCEGACTWSLAGGVPVAIGKLERFVCDHAPVPAPAAVRDTVPDRLSVAVVGSGPAGIAAAWALVEGGAAVTVYEKEPRPAGLMDWGIPEFTLPAAVAQRPWRQLDEAGVDLRCGVDVSPEDLGRLTAEHDAVVLAHGATVPMRLPVPGSDLDGVTDATTFLQAAKAALADGEDVAFRSGYGLPATGTDVGSSRVLVLGAGNTAMDAARTARRLGLNAVCVDWVDERFALARPDEFAEARHEGVQISFLRTVSRLEGEHGRVRRAVLSRTRQDRADRLPRVLDAGQEVLDVDLVVLAMGYRVDPAFAAMLPGTPLARTATGFSDRRWLASGLLANPASAFAHHSPVGRLALGREVGRTQATLPIQERVWVVGDALVGPSTVVEAMAQGRLAATAVLRNKPRRDRHPTPRQILVGYESRGGRTAGAARLVAAELRSSGAVVRAVPLAQITVEDLAQTDLLVLGTWVEGLVVAAVRPAAATIKWLEMLPRLPGLRTAIFCTYAVSPRSTLPLIRRELESRGSTVLAEAAFGRGDLTGPAIRFGGLLRELAVAH
jgi:glutamate synthase (NADPH/NADH) small chain